MANDEKMKQLESIVNIAISTGFLISTPIELGWVAH